MSRFTGSAAPTVPFDHSHRYHQDWSTLRASRTTVDAAIVAWAPTLEPAWFAQPGWKGRTNELLVMHLFNHQAHHRGQVHAMLTAAGASPADTDLLKM
jgi:uncharacterized damage-inducible protein DinB